MSRNHNTNGDGGAWSNQQKKEVWEKAEIITLATKDEKRKDQCGKVIKWDDHGNRKSDYGWEIDHIKAVANGGGDHIDNLQPLHWKNNLDKADKLFWSCPS